MAVHWSLQKSENDIYLFINGGRAANIADGGDLGPLQYVDYGRTSTELWFHFRGNKNGRRLDRTKFTSHEGFLEELDSSDSNAVFVKALTKFGIGQRKKKNPKPSNGNANQMPEPLYENMTNIISSPSEEIEFVKNKLVGQYEISTMRLQQAPKEFRCRELDDSWVDGIKSSMLHAPGGTVTIVPALLNPEEINNPDDFTSSRLGDYTIFLLGGNHLVQACRKLLEEEPDNASLSAYRTIKVDLYAGLSPEEAKMIGNLHNLRTCTKKMFFQDEVEQVREIYLDCGSEWKEVAHKVLKKMNKEKKLESMSTVFATASWDDEVFEEISRVFHIWRLENPQMEINQRIFRSIISVPKEKVLGFLRKIKTSKDMGQLCTAVEKEKKMSLLREIFIRRTSCKDWEEAEENYEEYTYKIEQFQNLNIHRRSIPREFVEFCDAAKEHRPLDETDVCVDYTVHVGDSYNHLLDHPSVKSLISSSKRKLSGQIEKLLKRLKSEE